MQPANAICDFFEKSWAIGFCNSQEDMATLAVIEERVNNHVRFFWAVAGVFLTWLLGISGFLISINSKIDHIPAALSSQLIEQSRRLTSEEKNEDAVRSLSLATTLIGIARTQRTKATANYFNETTKQLQQLLELSTELRGPTHGALLQLANYKSALEQPPSISGPEKSSYTPVTDPAFGKGASVLHSFVHGDMIIPPVVRTLGQIEFRSIVFIGDVPDASQTLDGIVWDNVTFVNMRIKYQGGEVVLKNVRFVNCTFDFPDDPKGNQMVAIIATRAELTIG